MSEIAMELDDQAGELGFESYEEAIACGYEIDAEALSSGVARLCIDREQEEAHGEWLKEKEGVLADLRCLRDDIWEENQDVDMRDALTRAIEFIMKGEC